MGQIQKLSTFTWGGSLTKVEAYTKNCLVCTKFPLVAKEGGVGWLFSADF